MSITVIQAIAAKVEYLKRCDGNAQFAKYVNAAQEKLDKLIKHLPSGSGIDAGVKLDFERSNSKCVVLTFNFHHMNDVGYYDGWTYHTAIVTPAFGGFNLAITGRDRNQIKDYLYDVFDYALRQKVDEDLQLHKESTQ
jgi:hypothetical protein